MFTVVSLHFSDDVCAHVFHENQFRFGATKSESVCWCDACVCLIARVHMCVCVFQFWGPWPQPPALGGRLGSPLPDWSSSALSQSESSHNARVWEQEREHDHCLGHIIYDARKIDY